MKRGSDQNQSHIRYSEDEYKVLRQDSEIYNETIPNLMKAAYFKTRLPQPIMYPDDARRVLAALNRIGNNINQIARQLNGGFRQGFNPAVEEMRENIRAMRNFLMGHHGDSKDQIC